MVLLSGSSALVFAACARAMLQLPRACRWRVTRALQMRYERRRWCCAMPEAPYQTRLFSRAGCFMYPHPASLVPRSSWDGVTRSPWDRTVQRAVQARSAASFQPFNPSSLVLTDFTTPHCSVLAQRSTPCFTMLETVYRPLRHGTEHEVLPDGALEINQHRSAHEPSSQNPISGSDLDLLPSLPVRLSRRNGCVTPPA